MYRCCAGILEKACDTLTCSTSSAAPKISRHMYRVRCAVVCQGILINTTTFSVIDGLAIKFAASIDKMTLLPLPGEPPTLVTDPWTLVRANASERTRF
eukprot:342821-Rhodomonas_salina.1